MALVKLHHPGNPDPEDFVITGEATAQIYLDRGFELVETLEDPGVSAAPAPAPAPEAEAPKSGGKNS